MATECLRAHALPYQHPRWQVVRETAAEKREGLSKKCVRRLKWMDLGPLRDQARIGGCHRTELGQYRGEFRDRSGEVQQGAQFGHDATRGVLTQIDQLGRALEAVVGISGN